MSELDDEHDETSILGLVDDSGAATGPPTKYRKPLDLSARRNYFRDCVGLDDRAKNRSEN